MANEHPVHTAATRRIQLTFDENGNPTARTVCSPESFGARALCVPPKIHVIPVIFVPGIMGTNLRSISDKSPAWRPPNGILAGLGEWNRRRQQSTVSRQKQLTPETCEVDPEGDISFPSGVYTLSEEEAKRRGWGEIHWDSYGKVLTELEKILNDQYEDCGKPNAKLLPEWKIANTLVKKKSSTVGAERNQHTETTDESVLKTWNPVKGECTPLTDAEIKHLDGYYYPVWACGYNWLQSNEESAKRLMKRIDEALDWYARPECQFIPEGRVIIVTHSMGGLVTRRAAQQVESKIIGVVHGVQPVGGAPVVYRRFRAGTENGGWWDIKGKMLATVLGNSAGAITAVMANSPGPMELLPTKDFPAGWLRFECDKNGQSRELMPALPQADPYEEIYAKSVQDVWWGLVDETLIDPADLLADQPTTAKEKYMRELRKAKKFHDTVKLYFHPQTFGHYGSDKDQVSFGAVHWKTTDKVPDSIAANLKTIKPESKTGSDEKPWDEHGNFIIYAPSGDIHFELANKHAPEDDSEEDAGDGTVPRQSGLLIEKGGDSVHIVFRMKGYEHGASYTEDSVIENVTYCLGKLVQLAKPIDQLPQSK